MMKSMDDRFASLAQVAKDLNSVSDEVSAQLRSVEERLKSLGLGVEIQLDVPLPHIEDLEARDLTVEEYEQCCNDPSTEDDPYREDPTDWRAWTGLLSYLTYKKLSGSWRLGVRGYACTWLLPPDKDPRTWIGGPDERTFDSERPLLDAPRDIRLAAAEQIDDLLAAIEKEAQERITRLHRSGSVRAAAGHPTDKPIEDVPGSVGGRVKQRRVPSDRTAR